MKLVKTVSGKLWTHSQNTVSKMKRFHALYFYVFAGDSRPALSKTIQILVDMLGRDVDEGIRGDNSTGDVIYRFSSVLSSIAGKDRQCEVSITHFTFDECFIS